jgi:HAMP domain-containing protein
MIGFPRNLNLGLKLNIVVILVLGLLLLAITFLLQESVNSLTRQTSRQRMTQEVEIVRSRFAEAEEEILADVKLLAAIPGLLEAVAEGNVASIKSTILVRGASLNFSDIDLVDADGIRLATMIGEGETFDIEQKEALLSLALLGIDATGAIVQVKEGGSEFRLAAVVPLRDSSGAIIGGLIGGREVNDEFLAGLNFAREDLVLVLIHEGEIVAESSQDEAHKATLTTGELAFLDTGKTEQASKGRTVIADDLITFDDIPHAMAHMPLTVGGETEAVIAVLANMDELVTFQYQLTTYTFLTFMVLTLVAVALVTLFTRQSIAVPIGKLKSIAEQMASGDYSQRMVVTTTDEIGKLARTFNQMSDKLRQTIEAEQQAKETLQDTVVEYAAFADRV